MIDNTEAPCGEPTVSVKREIIDAILRLTDEINKLVDKLVDCMLEQKDELTMEEFELLLTRNPDLFEKVTVDGDEVWRLRKRD